MGRMPFLLPLVFPVREAPKTELSDTTKKIYKSKLNNLAKEGFETVDSLKNGATAVIEAIKKLTGEGTTDALQALRRTYLSAIFWVVKMPKKNPYYTYWQKCMPSVNIETGLKWKKKKDL
jgi:hypothetical protein